MVKTILNDGHLGGVIGEALRTCRHRLFLATADVKDLHVPPGAWPEGRRRRSVSILEALSDLGRRGIEVRILHSGTPSRPVLQRLKDSGPMALTMRRCVRVHAKAVIVDGRWMYLGSANLTGAGLGAKSPRRRNFEAGVCTDQLEMIDPALDMLEQIWSGQACRDCGRKDHCPVPLEEPNL